MAGEFTRLRVLVASPDDVLEERSTARQVIDDINQAFSNWPIRLEFVGWENVPPGFNTDPQAVINDQIGDDYDIFVGILWTRFGTPTPRAESGTEEEFLRAYERWKENHQSVHLMVFFSDVPIEPSQCDPEQLARVKRFRQEISDKGGLYRTFRLREDFRQALTIALTERVAEWISPMGDAKATTQPAAKSPPTPLTPSVTPKSSSEDEEEEAGFLDLIALGTERFAKVTSTTEAMTETLRELTEDLEHRTEQLTQTKDTALMRRYLDGAGEDLMKFVKRTDEELEVFVSVYGQGMDAYSRAVRLLPEFGEPDTTSIQEGLDAIRHMKDSLMQSGASTKNLRQTVAALPPVTTAFKKARGKTITLLDRVTEEWLRAIQIASDVDSLLSGLLGRDEGSAESPILPASQLFIDIDGDDCVFAEPGTRGHPSSTTEASLSLRTQVSLHALHDTRVDSLELEVLGKRIPSSWNPNMVGAVPTVMYVYFEISDWVSPGEHSVRLVAFADGKWWRSSDYTITFPDRTVS